MRDLPPRVYLKTGTYYYVDKRRKWHPLGNERDAALSRHKILIGETPRTMGALFDMFREKVLSKKAAATQKSWGYSLKRLRPVFAHVAPDDVLPHHVWRYWELRGATRQARHEIQVLSSVFSWGLRWGSATKHPVLGLRFPRNPPRDRYVTDAEFSAARTVMPPRFQWVMDVAYDSGLRQNDVLRLRKAQATDDGITVTPSKAGPKLLIRWTATMKAAWDALASESPESEWLVTSRRGKPYTVDGFQAIWQRAMRKLPKAQRFQFRDIRAKSATDEKDVGRASKRLGHSTTRLTEEIYMRLPVEVPGLVRKQVGNAPEVAGNAPPEQEPLGLTT